MLTIAKQCYESLAAFRKNRDRCRDYTFGRQWNDLIEVNGHKITEHEYIVREGNIPLKNNLIRRVVRNVIGEFRKELPEISRLYGAELEGIYTDNSLGELFCRTFEEFLISGMAVHRKGFRHANGKTSIHTVAVSPSSLFFNSDSKDVRGRDIDLIGQFHDVGFRQWCRAFVNDEESYARAVKLFEKTGNTVNVAEMWRREPVGRWLVHDRRAGRLFKSAVRPPSDPDIEARWILDEVWRYYFLSPMAPS